MSLAAHLNVNCIDLMLSRPADTYEWIRFDSNNDCNLKCVYCHNSRSKEMMELATFEKFLSENVTAINNFQIGCRMEPTLDKRMVDFMWTLARSPVKPKQSMVLQTNGILLHRHDRESMVEAGLTDIQLSIDTIDPHAFAMLRGGAKIEKIQKNVSDFSRLSPEVRIKFVVTVSTLNAPHVEDLVQWGLDNGVGNFIVREMFHIPGGATVDDQKMEKLVLPEGEFLRLSESLKSKFGDAAFINCINKDGVLSYNQAVQSVSYAARQG